MSIWTPYTSRMTPSMDPGLVAWASERFDISDCQIQPLPVEASTRKFWRCTNSGNSWILMDSPPESENNSQFVALSDVFRRVEVPVPKVLAFDPDRGYLVVEDVGSRSFYTTYNQGSVDRPVSVAVDTILKIQSIKSSVVPRYTAQRLRDELTIFRDFVCGELLNTSPGQLEAITPNLVGTIDLLPKTTVHRDFHCRNLLWRDAPPNIGVVDFQDALFGPVTYDLASLLYDCYWNHTDETCATAIREYWTKSASSSIPRMDSCSKMAVAVKFTAVQRLLKAAGIFVRLRIQKNQASHLRHVVPTLQKAQRLCMEYNPLTELGRWLMNTIIPATSERLSK